MGSIRLPCSVVARAIAAMLVKYTYQQMETFVEDLKVAHSWIAAIPKCWQWFYRNSWPLLIRKRKDLSIAFFDCSEGSYREMEAIGWTWQQWWWRGWGCGLLQKWRVGCCGDVNHACAGTQQSTLLGKLLRTFRSTTQQGISNSSGPCVLWLCQIFEESSVKATSGAKQKLDVVQEATKAP